MVVREGQGEGMDQRIEICKGRGGEGAGKGLDGGGGIGRTDYAQGGSHAPMCTVLTARVF